MMKLALSRAATALIRALAARTGLPKDRIILTEARSVDWQSLTFIGERHEITLRLPPPGADEALKKLTEGLEDAEFDLPGHIVIDVVVVQSPVTEKDGSILVDLEALTIRSDD